MGSRKLSDRSNLLQARLTASRLSGLKMRAEAALLWEEDAVVLVTDAGRDEPKLH
jgi:hypothetical protein